MLKVDHVFSFVSFNFPEVEKLNHHFQLPPGKIHEHQGTRNRSILLRDSYIEFVWCDNAEVAKNNFLTLQQRQNWESSRWSPFGLCLRGKVPEDLEDQVVPYEVGQLVIPVLKASMEDPTLPLIFFIDALPTWDRFSKEHADYFQHACGASKVSKILIEQPYSKKMGLVPQIEGVDFAASDEFHMTITVDTKLDQKIQVNKCLDVNLAKK